jgi:hypothetical protein
MIMNIQALKIDIIHWLTELRDERVLEKIQGIRESTENVSLSASQKEELESRLESLENGTMEFKTWEEARAAIKNSYNDKL